VAAPLRLIVFDRTQEERSPKALGWSWRYGTLLYRAIGRVDGAFGARSLSEMWHWLATHERDRQIAELQFWGHGKWGRFFVAEHSLGSELLTASHAQHAAFLRFRERLTADALIWFRTCETLGAQAGRDFAARLGDATGARVAGHTFVIGFFQSGLHCLAPGAATQWAIDEGLQRGTPSSPLKALTSHPGAPNTITCFDGAVPAGF